MTKVVANEAELSEWVKREVAPQLKKGDWIWLEGDLGAGKTTFVRYLMRAFGYEDQVVSPTYPLLVEYELENFKVIHIDGYRLDSKMPNPWDFREWEGAVVLVEWGEKTRLPRERFRYSMIISRTDESEDSRRIEWKESLHAN